MTSDQKKAKLEKSASELLASVFALGYNMGYQVVILKLKKLVENGPEEAIQDMMFIENCLLKNKLSDDEIKELFMESMITTEETFERKFIEKCGTKS